MKTIFCLLFTALALQSLQAQPCTPAGDETAYGISDTWIGYVYDNINFTAYSGYINEGVTGNPNFNESFGGDDVTLATNGCPVYTASFSVRYKLRKTLTPGNYQITVGGDDGFRLSIDGGATWIINRWYDQAYNFTAYTAFFSGSYDMVLEYYENGGGNRVSFNISPACVAAGDQSAYGSGNIWNGYLYTGTAFDNYAGAVTEGIATNANFDENYGGSNTVYSTTDCNIITEQFSARYRLQKTFASGNYTFIVGGDDGFRLSLDGGTTWVINRWFDQGYTTSSYTAALSGSYNMVLEFYENGGDNRLSFAITGLLPVELSRFNGRYAATGNILDWTAAASVNSAYYQVERSSNGIDYAPLGQVAAVNTDLPKDYTYTDRTPLPGDNYYRLRMVDNDGHFNYSAVIHLLTANKTGTRFYPSLVDAGVVYLHSATMMKAGRVALFDMTGKQVQQMILPAQVNAGQTLPIYLRQQAAGNYLLVCSNGGTIISKQIIRLQH
jgi:hypothetical protein